jgi:hypothetical protein
MSLAALAAEPARSVEVDLSSLNDNPTVKVDAPGLETQLVVRLLQEGFAVHPRGTPATLKMKITSAPPQLRVVATCGDRSREAAIVPGNESLAEIQLEVIQKAAELVRALMEQCLNAPPPPSPPPPPPQALEPKPPSVDQLPPLPGPPSAIVVDARLELGFEIPTGEYIQAGLRVGEDWAGHLVAGVLLPPNQALDWTLEMGVGYRRTFHPRFDIEPFLLAGVLTYGPLPAASILFTTGVLLRIFISQRVLGGFRTAMDFAPWLTGANQFPFRVQMGGFIGFQF